MIRAALIGAVAGLAAMAGPAGACSPVVFTPSDRPTTGEGCAIVWHLGETRAVGLSPARDLGAGFLLQDVFDGNACYWEANLAIHDCARDEVLVIGPDNRDLMSEPRETGIDRLDAAMTAAAEAGEPMLLAAVATAAEAEGYATRLTVPTGQRIVVNGHPVAIDCACRTHYPDLGRGH